VKRWEWWSWGGIASLAVVLVVATWVAWEPTPTDPPRAREYRQYNLCLFTGQQGITVEPGKTAWQGLQEVSSRTSVMLPFVSMPGEQTVPVAKQFLASLVQQQCGIIVALGEVQVAAVTADRDRYPDVKFVTLSGTESASDVTARVLPLVPKA
jgi:hypothetical protein